MLPKKNCNEHRKVKDSYMQKKEYQCMASLPFEAATEARYKYKKKRFFIFKVDTTHETDSKWRPTELYKWNGIAEGVALIKKN